MENLAVNTIYATNANRKGRACFLECSFGNEKEQYLLKEIKAGSFKSKKKEKKHAYL